MYRLALGHERMLTLIKVTLQFPPVLYRLIGSAFFNFRHMERKPKVDWCVK